MTKKHTLPSFSAILTLAWRNVWPNYWRLILVSLVSCVLLLPLTIIVYLNPGLIAGGQAIQTPFFWVYMLLTILVGLWLKTSLRYAVIHPNIESVVELYKQSLKFLLPLFLTSFLVFFIGVSSYLTLFFCFIPLFILLIHVWFADWYIIVDNEVGFKALIKSRSLTKGIFWRAAVKILAPWLIFFVINFACVFYLRLTHAGQMNLINNLFTSLIQIVSWPLMVQYDYELFQILKKRKDVAPVGTATWYKFLFTLGLILSIGFLALFAYIKLFHPELFLPVDTEPTHGAINLFSKN